MLLLFYLVTGWLVTISNPFKFFFFFLKVYKWTCCSRISLFHSTFRVNSVDKISLHHLKINISENLFSCQFAAFSFQYKHLKQDDDPYVQIEGKDTEDWMCIDFGKYLLISQMLVL